jgi:hypothetical protein
MIHFIFGNNKLNDKECVDDDGSLPLPHPYPSILPPPILHVVASMMVLMVLVELWNDDDDVLTNER